MLVRTAYGSRGENHLHQFVIECVSISSPAILLSKLRIKVLVLTIFLKKMNTDVCDGQPLNSSP